jgi:hypothetical protein
MTRNLDRWLLALLAVSGWGLFALRGPQEAAAPAALVAARPPSSTASIPPPPPVHVVPGAAADAGIRNPAPPRELFQPLIARQPILKERSRSRPRAESRRPPPVPAEPPREPDLALVGVVVAGGRPRAVIENLDDDVSRAVREGDSVFGYRVGRITGASVELARGSETRTVRLGEDKPPPKVEILSDGFNIRLTDPRNAMLAALPGPALTALARVLPSGGELRRVRPQTENGERVFEVQKRIDGLTHEVAVAPDGRILRIEAQVRAADLPRQVVAAAESAAPGYTLSRSDTPRLWDRFGQRYYEVEVVRGREELDLRITPDGRVLGRG